MCYNSGISFLFAAIGFLVTFYIFIFDKIINKTGIQYILGFYSIMELLQGVQYFYVNQCSNFMNIILTEFAYLLVILQPLIWNIFFYVNSGTLDKQIFLTAICLSIPWIIVNVLARLLYDKNKYPQTKQNSPHAGDKVCTKRKLSHLFWEWTSENFQELNANFFMYLMVWFIPALISKKFRNISFVLIVSAVLGAYMTFLTDEPVVFTSLWCYISVPIVLVVLLVINKEKSLKIFKT